MLRQRLKTWLVCAAVVGHGVPAIAEDAVAETPQGTFFAQQVAPLIAGRCLECHHGPEAKGGLDLSQRASALRGGESGPVLLPGHAAESLLWERVEGDEMPPEHPLSEEEKKILRDWIDQGLDWQGDRIDPLRYGTDRRAGYDWWSLQPLADVMPPEVQDPVWPRNEMDRFVLRRIEQAGLAPAAEAEPRTLVRRVFYDLIGLPPTPDQVRSFVADPSDAAYEKIVDQLLASPHYGERWGRHWLDVVRFGESDGFERNAPRDHLWHYRDWVIQAFNDDMPYTEFVRQQLAGDLLQPGLPGAAAAGFLVAGVHNTVVGSSERMQRLARQDELEEMIGTVGQTFLGLTLNCGRCHDHKFDPISSREYYALVASIDGVQHGNRQIMVDEVARQLPALEQRIQELEKEIHQIDDVARRAILAQRRQAPTPKDRSDAERPRPYASWDFSKGLQDQVGQLHVTPMGDARLNGQALVVDGQTGFALSAPLDRDLEEKTLEAWVLLDDLDQRGGATISLQSLDGSVFDAIVFGEQELRRWMAGSDGFQRTRSFAGPAEEQATVQPVCMAVVYHQDGTIAAYRNGVPYGEPYQTGFQRFASGKAQVAFGLRHAPPSPGRLLAGQILRASLYDKALSAQAIAAAAGVANDYVSPQAITDSLAPETHARRERWHRQLKAAQRQRDELAARARVEMYTVVPRDPGEMRVHLRGSVTDFGEIVRPSGVRAIRGTQADFGIPANASDAERRTHLAMWITDPANPLLARVITNRLWHYHFARGIVDTPNDFGFNGGRPTHPQLLDWLANQLRANDYRLKPLHRLIVMSATYRQASESNASAMAVDADNRLLWRYSPRRVSAEVLRDSILAVAGELNLKRGGPGFRDVTVTYNDGTTYYEPIDAADAELYRRSVYRFTPRGGRSAILDTFDCPDPSATAPRRSVTTTPLQALTLMNNAFVLRMADYLAARLQTECGSDVAQQVSRAWLLTLGREPDTHERVASLQLVERAGLSTLCRGLFNLNEFIVIQ